MQHWVGLYRLCNYLRSLILILNQFCFRFLPLHLESEWVYADEEFLKEAIGNLVDNSIKYSGEEVDIQISSLRQDYNFYLIKVRDNGIGIPLKDQSRIFEKYERASAADRSRKGGASGFGLGLNYVFPTSPPRQDRCLP